MSLFNWPFTRKSYAGIENPIYVSDTQAATEAAIQSVKALAGLNDTDFAIITGLDYTAGVPNTYTSGIYYLNGVFYYQQAVFDEGFYLTSNFTDELLESFTDGTPRYIYTVQYSTTSASPTNNTPVFSGNMNAYRIGSKYVAAAVLALQAIANGLGNSSTLNVGTIAGTVAAGNDTRLVYTQAQFDTLFAGRMPSNIGAIYQHYDISNTFASNFDGTGLGIVAPFVGWALMNGNNGTPDMSGLGTICQGVYTNPDLTTTTYVSKTEYGEREHVLTTPEIPSHTHGNSTNSGKPYEVGITVGDFLSSTNTGTAATGIANAGGGLGHNNIPPVMAIYMAIKIA